MCIKNRTCYYFDDIINLEDFNRWNLIDEKSHKSILIYDISYKNLINWKPLRIIFDKIGRFITTFDGTRCLVLFGSEKYDEIYNRIRCLVILKGSTTKCYMPPAGKFCLCLDGTNTLKIASTYVFFSIFSVIVCHIAVEIYICLCLLIICYNFIISFVTCGLHVKPLAAITPLKLWKKICHFF